MVKIKLKFRSASVCFSPAAAYPRPMAAGSANTMRCGFMKLVCQIHSDCDMAIYGCCLIQGEGGRGKIINGCRPVGNAPKSELTPGLKGAAE